MFADTSAGGMSVDMHTDAAKMSMDDEPEITGGCIFFLRVSTPVVHTLHSECINLADRQKSEEEQDADDVEMKCEYSSIYFHDLANPVG